MRAVAPSNMWLAGDAPIKTWLEVRLAPHYAGRKGTMHIHMPYAKPATRRHGQLCGQARACAYLKSHGTAFV